MVKGLPIEMAQMRNPAGLNTGVWKDINQRLNEAGATSVSGTAEALEITDFPEEMKECIQLDEELERYFHFLSKLSRDQLLAIVKYEVYNRVLTQELATEEETNE